MTPPSPKQAVLIALKAMQGNQADHEVAQDLVTAGVDPAGVATFVESIG